MPISSLRSVAGMVNWRSPGQALHGAVHGCQGSGDALGEQHADGADQGQDADAGHQHAVTHGMDRGQNLGHAGGGHQPPVQPQGAAGDGAGPHDRVVIAGVAETWLAAGGAIATDDVGIAGFPQTLRIAGHVVQGIGAQAEGQHRQDHRRLRRQEYRRGQKGGVLAQVRAVVKGAHLSAPRIGGDGCDQ